MIIYDYAKYKKKYIYIYIYITKKLINNNNSPLKLINEIMVTMTFNYS